MVKTQMPRKFHTLPCLWPGYYRHLTWDIQGFFLENDPMPLTQWGHMTCLLPYRQWVKEVNEKESCNYLGEDSIHPSFLCVGIYPG